MKKINVMEIHTTYSNDYDQDYYDEHDVLHLKLKCHHVNATVEQDTEEIFHQYPWGSSTVNTYYCLDCPDCSFMHMQHDERTQDLLLTNQRTYNEDAWGDALYYFQEGKWDEVRRLNREANEL